MADHQQLAASIGHNPQLLDTLSSLSSIAWPHISCAFAIGFLCAAEMCSMPKGVGGEVDLNPDLGPSRHVGGCSNPPESFVANKGPGMAVKAVKIPELPFRFSPRAQHLMLIKQPDLRSSVSNLAEVLRLSTTHVQRTIVCCHGNCCPFGLGRRARTIRRPIARRSRTSHAR